MENTLRCPARIGHLPPVAACVQEKRLRELRSVIVQKTQAKNSAEVVVVRQESEQNSALDCNHEKRLSDRVLRFFDLICLCPGRRSAAQFLLPCRGSFLLVCAPGRVVASARTLCMALTIAFLAFSSRLVARSQLPAF
jgi:hypothetical protein